MKNLIDYVSEAHRQYEYRIKIAGDLPEGFYDKFKKALGMFDVQSCTKPKKTPIQSDPYGFPGLKNEEVYIFDIALNYPANDEQIIELARRHGVTPARVVVVGKHFNDSINAEAEAAQEESDLLVSDYPEQTKEQKEASDAYADSYKEAAANFANDGGAEFEIAGKANEPQAKDMGPEGVKSPLSTVKRKSIRDMLK